MSVTKATPEQGCVTVYYDGSCPLCTAEINHYASREGGDQIAFVDVSQDEAAPAPDLDNTSAMRRFHVRGADGELVSGARGFIVLWETLPGWRWLARVGRLPGISLLLEGLYRLFLPVRPILSRLFARLFVR